MQPGPLSTTRVKLSKNVACHDLLKHYRTIASVVQPLGLHDGTLGKSARQWLTTLLQCVNSLSILNLKSPAVEHYFWTQDDVPGCHDDVPGFRPSLVLPVSNPAPQLYPFMLLANFHTNSILTYEGVTARADVRDLHQQAARKKLSGKDVYTTMLELRAEEVTIRLPSLTRSCCSFVASRTP
jgi:hypothetical protein